MSRLGPPLAAMYDSSQSGCNLFHIGEVQLHLKAVLAAKEGIEGGKHFKYTADDVTAANLPMNLASKYPALAKYGKKKDGEYANGHELYEDERSDANKDNSEVQAALVAASKDLYKTVAMNANCGERWARCPALMQLHPKDLGLHESHEETHKHTEEPDPKESFTDAFKPKDQSD